MRRRTLLVVLAGLAVVVMLWPESPSRIPKDERVMTKRRLWWLLTTLVVLSAFAAFVYLPWPCPVTRQNFDRVKAGMTEQEVFAIFGEPGDYRNFDTEYAPPPPREPADWFGRGTPRATGTYVWRGDEAEVCIEFARGPDGRLTVTNGMRCNLRAKSDDRLVNAQWRAQHRWEGWLRSASALVASLVRAIGPSQPAR
jgi:hypothetical protein